MCPPRDSMAAFPTQASAGADFIGDPLHAVVMWLISQKMHRVDRYPLP